jgi:hypothetical protein
MNRLIATSAAALFHRPERSSRRKIQVEMLVPGSQPPGFQSHQDKSPELPGRPETRSAPPASKQPGGEQADQCERPARPLRAAA